MKYIFLLRTTLLTFGLTIFTAACDKSSSNPETIDQTDLNPPGALTSVTDSQKIQLRWTTGNAEKDFKGYHVFAAQTDLATLAATIQYPEGADVTTGVSVARCGDNNDFFKAFGFTNTDAKCDHSLFGKNKSSGTTTDTTTDKTKDSKTLTNFVPCAEATDSTSMSLPVTGPSVSLQKCTITKAWDATTGALVDLQNGKSYVFFVVAVADDDLDQISWTSNIIEDVPSKTAFATDGIALPQGRYVAFEFNGDSTSADFLTATLNDNNGAGFPCPAGSTNTPCWLTSGNTESLDGIYLARDNVNPSYKQRIFISTKTGGHWQIQPVPLQKDDHAVDDTNLYLRIPGDTAVKDSDDAPYPSSGTTFTVYDHKLFDVVYTADGTHKYYGKLIVTDLSYASDAATATATVDVTIVMQPKANDIHYLY